MGTMDCISPQRFVKSIDQCAVWLRNRGQNFVTKKHESDETKLGAWRLEPKFELTLLFWQACVRQ